MPVYDQFETEPYVFYSGSYNDYIFRDVSSIFQNTISQTLDRRAIGTNIGGLFVKTFANITAVRNYFSPFLISDFLKLYRNIPGATTFVALNDQKSTVGLFESFTCSDEIYYDSVLPNPLDITLENGGQLIWAQKFNDTADPYYDNFAKVPLYDNKTIQTPVNKTMFIALGDRNIRSNNGLNVFSLTASSVGGSEQQVVSDNLWAYNYPFQSKYKNIIRLTKNSVLSPKSYFPTVSASNLDRIVEANGATTKLFLRTTLTSSNIFGGVGIANFGTVLDVAYFGTIDISGSVSPPEEINRFYYGFGNGRITTYNREFINKFPETFSVLGASFSLSRVGPKPRGFKYGILSHVLKPTTVKFRRNRFGQFRDMIEQRPYTKFWNGERVLESAVQVSFVSGTQAYANAIDYVNNNNPSYDPRDSGFWDYEYKSGQPFFDIDNID